MSRDPKPPIEWKGAHYERVHIIRHSDPHAGFCALITYALNEVRLSKREGWLAVVRYDDQVNTYFHDPAVGPNVWDYYFEPVMGVDYAEVEARLRSGELQEDRLHTYPADDVIRWHSEDPERIATFWSVDTPADPAAWMAEKRQLGRRFVAEHVKVKPGIRDKVDRFYDEALAGAYAVGVHIRGTDFAYAEPTRPEAYFAAIREHVAQVGQPDFRIFLATDQAQFVDAFRAEFGDRVVTYESLRASADVPVFLAEDVPPYRKGEDVLIDVLLLSRTDYLFKCAAAAGEYAMWFNEKLECTDFGLESRYDSSNFATAFLKFNMGGMSTGRWRVYLVALKAARTLKRALLDRALALGRRVLPPATRDWLWTRFGRRLFSPANSTPPSDA